MDDMGISSCTLASCYYNPYYIERADLPYDPSDFGRCYRFLERIGRYKQRTLDRVAKKYPKWKPFVDNWEELEALWIEESPSGVAPKLYKRMQELRLMPDK